MLWLPKAVPPKLIEVTLALALWGNDHCAVIRSTPLAPIAFAGTAIVASVDGLVSPVCEAATADEPSTMKRGAAPFGTIGPLLGIIFAPSLVEVDVERRGAGLRYDLDLREVR
jgi:hypothetical protein